MNAREVAQAWLDSPIDSKTKKTIQTWLSQDAPELEESFYRDLEFGTGGLRGIMGVGSNRMNRYTVGMATQGLANYLKKSFPGEEIKVAVAHDSRNNSELFAQVTADVMSANGIMVYLFEGLRPTPQLSFAIRQLGCHSGVVVTASHNPKEYNGYKAYWQDGGQLVPPHDKNVMAEVRAIEGIADVKFDGDEDLIVTLEAEADEKYRSMVAGLSLAPEVVERQKDLCIVFSPIHGTGIVHVPAVLEKMGFRNVNVVEEQKEPNGDFPTVVYPNPEEAEAMSMALAKAKELQADLVLATDPDTDRVGIAVRDLSGRFVLLNGNQTGALLVNHVLEAAKKAGKLALNDFVVKTIVTTELIADIAQEYQVKSYDTLTGFKYIAELIRELEGKERFLVGGEESYGYLVGDSVRDKDAVASAALIAEMAAMALDSDKTVYEKLVELYLTHGLYKEKLVSITRKGKSGSEEIAKMMSDLRQAPPKTLGGETVTAMLDYQGQQRTDLTTGEKTPLDFPSSNVLQFLTAQGSKISARPSGTEPKIKFYFGVKEALASKEDLDTVSAALDAKVASFITDLGLD